MAEEIKLSEMFKEHDILKIISWPPEYTKQGIDWALDNVTPKVALAFVQYTLDQSTGTIGDQFICKDLAYNIGRDNYKGNCGFTKEQMWNEFLKQYNPGL